MNPGKKNKRPGKAQMFWYPLDNAAKIYPATISNESPAVFRLSAILANPVKIKSFLKAVSKAQKRFPYFKVQLKKGFFWYYLEHKPFRFPVEADRAEFCRKFSNAELLMRILVRENQISVEFSHVLTDGVGAFEFLKTILVLYSLELGVQIPLDFEYLKPGDPIQEVEYQDSYLHYFKEEIPPMVKRSKSFHLPWPLKSLPRLRVKNFFVSVDEVKNLAADKAVSINDYLVSVYLYLLQEIYEECKIPKRSKKFKHIRIQVPINLRNIFPSKTMRNFSLFVMPEIDLRLGHYSFDEIIKTVYHQIRLESDEKLINKNISRNVGSEKKLYVKSMPLFLKSFILKMIYYSLGTKQYSGVITNLGRVDLPSEMAGLIDHFIFTPPPPNKMLKVCCGIIGFGDQLVLSFGNITKSTKLEEKFIQFFKEQGVQVSDEPVKKQ